MKCDLCHTSDAEYFIKKIPPGIQTPKQHLHLCSGCAGKYLQKDTVSIVRISKERKEES